MFSKFIYLDNEIEKYFSGFEDPFKKVKEIDGDVYRKTANRITKKFVLKNKTYFLKYHGPIGYVEILKNILKFQLPTVSARKEWNALQKLQSKGINCPSPIAICSKGVNPAKSHSFIITESLEPNISIEDAFELKAVNKKSVSEKKKIIERVGSICRNLHSIGLNHRDLYLCHFLIDATLNPDKPISLIDLHRAQIRNKVPERWLVKDIGGLYHSAIRFGITERDCYRFLMAYFNCSLKDLFSNHEEFIKKARKRAFSMYMKPVLNEIDITSKNALQEQSLYRKSFTKNHRWIGLKDKIPENFLTLIQDEEALLSTGEVIKNEEGHLVVKIDLSGKSYFVKKYRIKNLFHMIRRLFRKTRARNSWEVLHWLHAVGIRTMKPVLIYEELGFAGALNSVLVTEKIAGKRLDKIIKEKGEHIKIASCLHNFFKRMQWLDFHHGDAKSSNFFISKDKLYVFDLDSSKRHLKSSTLAKKINKDKKRILRSLEESTELTEALKLRFKGRKG